MNNAHRDNRRSFLRKATASSAAAITAPYWLTTAAMGAEKFEAANDRPHFALIGAGGRGKGIAKQAMRFGEPVAVCDVDLRQAELAKQMFGGKADVYQDYRKLLERQDIEVIVNGTPDHWHTAVNIAACKAGKDVYTEKPLTLTIEEGKTLCNVVEETGRIVQVGTQQRSARQFQTAVELVRNGRIGKLRHVAVLLPFWSTKSGPCTEQPVPADLDWDAYQGQAPERPYHPARTHFTYRWWWEYAGGIICDWGNHHMDIAHWGMGQEYGGPLTIEGQAYFPNAGKPLHYNNPDRFALHMKYPEDVDLSYLVVRDNKYLASMQAGDVSAEADAKLFRDVPEDLQHEQRNGIMFTGEKGRVFVNRGGVFGKAAEELKENPLPDDAWRVKPSNNHMGNFFESVKTRERPVSTVQMQHRTISACHLGNIAMRLERKITWDPEKQQIVGDDEANAWQRREQHPPYRITV